MSSVKSFTLESHLKGSSYDEHMAIVNSSKTKSLRKMCRRRGLPYTGLQRHQLLSSLDEWFKDYHDVQDESDDDEESSGPKLATVYDTHNFGEIVDNKKFADVTFKVGPGKEVIHAHRVLLAARSPVFAAMLFSQFAEASSGFVIEVPDIPPKFFRMMLKTIYTDEPPDLDEELLVGCLFVAKKYQVEVLRASCVRFMKKKVNAKNAIMLFEATPALLEEERAHYLTFVGEHADDIVSSKAFLEAEPDTVKAIVACDNLNVEEIVLFKAVLKWARYEWKRRHESEEDEESKQQAQYDALQAVMAKIRTQQLESDAELYEDLHLPTLTAEQTKEVLKDILPHIRFPLMEVPDLAMVVMPSGILDKSQSLALYSHASLRQAQVEAGVEEDDDKKKEYPLVGGFISAPRSATAAGRASTWTYHSNDVTISKDKKKLTSPQSYRSAQTASVKRSTSWVLRMDQCSYVGIGVCPPNCPQMAEYYNSPNAVVFYYSGPVYLAGGSQGNNSSFATGDHMRVAVNFKKKTVTLYRLSGPKDTKGTQLCFVTYPAMPKELCLTVSLGSGSSVTLVRQLPA